ncbi:MAG: TOBE domain-containing protein, partial [Oscillospiraceae bacterium]|nr:TOBE domain-containing protein [Oscillospiraceae bacterium]
IGTPKKIYDEPKNAFVADFIGESNIVDGVMLEDYMVRFAGMRFVCVDKGFAKNERVDVVIRPEDVDIVAPGTGLLTGIVTSVTFKGVHYEFIVDVKGFKWLIQSTDVQEVGDEIGILIKPDEIHVMKKSAYSDLVGDYSSYSDAFDELSNPDAEGDET